MNVSSTPIYGPGHRRLMKRGDGTLYEPVSGATYRNVNGTRSWRDQNGDTYSSWGGAIRDTSYSRSSQESSSSSSSSSSSTSYSDSRNYAEGAKGFFQRHKGKFFAAGVGAAMAGSILALGPVGLVGAIVAGMFGLVLYPSRN
jgi:hypothetical protein